MTDELVEKLKRAASETRVANVVLRCERFVRDEVRLSKLTRDERIAFGKQLVEAILDEVACDEREKQRDLAKSAFGGTRGGAP